MYRNPIYTYTLALLLSVRIIDNLIKKRNIFTHLISYVNKCPTNHS